MNRATGKHVGWRWQWAVGGTLGAIVVALAICEILGWPFLAAPMQRWLGDALERRVSLSTDSKNPKVTIHLLGGISMKAAHIEIGAPAWSKEPYMLRVEDASLTLGYLDLWRASRGEPLRIRELSARQIDGRVERLADGRASWQFGKKTDTPDTRDKPMAMPSFGRLQVDDGSATVRDALMAASLDAKFSLVDSSRLAAAGAAGSAPSPASMAASTSAASGSASGSALGPAPPGLHLNAKGTYQNNPVTVKVDALGVLAVLGEGASTLALPVVLDLRIGGAALNFNGTATDALQLTALKGRFSVQGPSLAAIGDPLHVTLPTTGPFRTEGLIAKDGLVWNAVFDSATIGSSCLAGAFQYDPRPKLPVLSGRLTGPRLLLADLGPAVGTSAPAGAASAPVAPARATPAAASRKGTPPAANSSKPGRVLPDREFDLPSLRAMNANVLIDIENLDLGTSFLAPLKPLRAHLVLTDGVLALEDIEARTSQGRLFGMVKLDGRGQSALWNADLGWDDIHLEDWVQQARGGDAPPYITGRMAGQARVAGQGKSTAAILGSLRGGVRLRIADGSVSHLAVEGAGLDLAQGLGILVKGDQSLPLRCTVADFAAEQGVLKPRAFIIDTRDSLLWVDGTVSLANEGLDLKVTTSPKDFSPMSLRTPVRLRGSFADPSISLDPSRIGPRVGVAAVLALVNPLAALIPFIDTGDKGEAAQGSDTCRELSRRIAERPALPAPPAEKKPARSRG